MRHHTLRCDTIKATTVAKPKIGGNSLTIIGSPLERQEIGVLFHTFNWRDQSVFLIAFGKRHQQKYKLDESYLYRSHWDAISMPTTMPGHGNNDARKA